MLLTEGGLVSEVVIFFFSVLPAQHFVPVRISAELL